MTPVRVGVCPEPHCIQPTKESALLFLPEKVLASSRLPFKKLTNRREGCLLVLVRFCALVCLGKEQCSGAGCSGVCPVSIPSLADPSLVTCGKSHGKLAEYFHIHHGRL